MSQRLSYPCHPWFGIFALLLSTTLPHPVAAGHDLQIQIVPRFQTAPLIFDSLTNATAVGQIVSVTRLDFLLSNFSLRRENGSWFVLSNQFAFVSTRESRAKFCLTNLDSGNYNSLRFQVGLPSKENHADPARLAADHPLNPTINGLHWSWQGGYVFMALEGNWLNPDGHQRGYSYHLATDRQLRAIELPLELDLAGDRALRLALNVDRIFSGERMLTISDESASTHSREEDKLADLLGAHLERAFAVEDISPIRHFVPPATTSSKFEMAPNATPYRLKISGFFPQPTLPRDNPLTEEGVALGRALFHEPRLSVNLRQSCASCHQPEAGFVEAGQATSQGAEGKSGTRNAMPLFNLAWKSAFFWDGRAATLREQVLQPIQNPVEMHEALTNVVAKLNSTVTADESGAFASAGGKGLVDYPTLFERAFGTPEVTADRLARALEQFLLAQVSHDAKFDRALRGETELNPQEKRGFELFHTEYDPRRGQFGADCFHCHGGPLFQSQAFANNGLDAEFTDAGRQHVTGREGDRGKFAVPSLRNVEITGPYMHDGRIKTLEEAVEHYTVGVKRSSTLDPNLAKHPDGGVPLNTEDKQALAAFLRTLTDARFARPASPAIGPP